jgi:hypothetical protein
MLNGDAISVRMDSTDAPEPKKDLARTLVQDRSGS